MPKCCVAFSVVWYIGKKWYMVSPESKIQMTFSCKYNNATGQLWHACFSLTIIYHRTQNDENRGDVVRDNNIFCLFSFFNQYIPTLLSRIYKRFAWVYDCYIDWDYNKIELLLCVFSNTGVVSLFTCHTSCIFRHSLTFVFARHLFVCYFLFCSISYNMYKFRCLSFHFTSLFWFFFDSQILRQLADCLL